VLYQPEQSDLFDEDGLHMENLKRDGSKHTTEQQRISLSEYHLIHEQM
jgi:hypothetical protein